MVTEVDLIQRSIPADRLCIQWDVCYEIVGAEGKIKLPYADAVADSIERIGRLCGNANSKTELGIHLCYGDPGHRHIVEPKDLGVSVAFANGICRASPRRVDFIHMPVPRARADESYLRRLRRLRCPGPQDLFSVLCTTPTVLRALENGSLWLSATEEILTLLRSAVSAAGTLRQSQICCASTKRCAATNE